jgi:uncharacterized protein YjdB
MSTSKFRKALIIIAVACCSGIPGRAKDTAKPVVHNQKMQAARFVFSENRGQIADEAGRPRPDILFSAHSGGAQVFLTATGIHYQFAKTTYPDGYDMTGASKFSTEPTKQAELEAQIINETYHFSLTLAGANTHPVIRRESKNRYTENFYLPQCPDGIIDVATYSRIVYQDIYPDIDWVVYSKDNHLKYDFIVRPGGDVSNIRLQVKNATGVRITKRGELQLQTPLGEVLEQQPVSYAAGKAVSSRFVLNNDASVGFAVAPFAAGATLVIDPSVSWATYFGGTLAEGGTAGTCVTDASGNVYITGQSQSTSGIATSGAYQVVAGGSADAYLAKFDATGAILWATYYGGTGSETIQGSTSDASGNIYISGFTTSAGIASPTAFQTTFSGTSTSLLAKFSPAGIRLWATYYNEGTIATQGFGCATDGSGNVYLSGIIPLSTAGTTGLGTAGTYQPVAPGGAADGFLAKFDASGNRLWGTYCGTTATDQIRPVAVDGSGNVYICGNSASTSGFATLGAFQTTSGGGSQDGIIAKLTSSGALVWASYYGGAGTDQVIGLAADAADNLYITGITGSTGGIASTGAAQTALGGGNDAFIAKFDASGARVWGTYYGGTGTEQGISCTTDAAGNVYFAGTTASTSGIAVGGFQSTIGGSNDAMVVKLNATGALQWASYFGGTAAESGTGIALGSGIVYMSGLTASTAGIATTGAYQTTEGGSNDAFLVQIQDAIPVSITTGTITGSPFCPGATVGVPYTITGTFTAGNIYTAQLSDASGSFTSPVDIGTLASVAAGTITATIPSAAAAGTGYRIRVISNTPADTGTINSSDLTISPLPVAGTVSGTATVCISATTPLTDATGDAGGTWSSTVAGNATVDASGMVTGIAVGTTTISYTVTNSCGTVAATQVVTVNPLPAQGSITGTSVVCPGATTPLADAAGDAGGAWSSTLTANATVDATGTVTGVAAGTSTISYTVTNSCGTVAATSVVTVNPLPAPGSITGTAVVCVAATTALSDGASGGVWSSTTPANATVDASGVVTGVAVGTASISYTVTNSCGTAAATTVVTINPLPDAGAITGTAVVCAGATTPLSDPASGGAWSSTVTANATVDAAGVVTGVATGTSTISYTVTNSCGTAAATQVVTVNPLPVPGTITGTLIVCEGATTSLSNVATGGAWSSALPAIGTVSASGVVTGIAAGTTTISYTVSNSCGTAAATQVITVSALPDAGTITGTLSACQSNTSPLSDAATGGAWSSTITAVATIGATGVVVASAAGTTTISYTVTNSCGTAAATAVFTVNPLPNPGTISGAGTVCVGSSITLTDAASGGAWSSTASSIASVTAGTVTGIASGTAVISYTVTNGCGTLAATRIITVNPLPAPGTITGSAMLCQLSTAVLADAASGGVWSSTTTAVATITSSGVVTGVAGGTSTISYTVINICGTAAATKVVTINATPFVYAVTGGGNYCAGGAGYHIGLSGSATGIDYQLYLGATTSGAPVSGTAAAIDFGVFTTSGTYTVRATNATTGCVSNMSAGAVISITAVVVPSVTMTNSGTNDSSCTGVAVLFTATPANGGSSPMYQWMVNGVAAAPTGNMYSYMPVNGDIVKVKLSSSAACAIPDSAFASDTMTVLVSEMPSLTVTASSNPACVGSTVTFTATPAFGGDDPSFLWTENGINVATGPWYIYDPMNGDAIYGLLISNYFCRLADTVFSADTITMSMVTSAPPVVTITAVPGIIIMPGQVDTLTAVVAGTSGQAYQWVLNGVNIPGATTAAYFGTFNNNDLVTCVVTDLDACAYDSFATVTILVASGATSLVDGDVALSLAPNPNNGTFVICGSWTAGTNEEADIDIVNTLGQRVYQGKLMIRNGAINASINPGNNLSAGMYIVDIAATNRRKVIRFVKE